MNTDGYNSLAGRSIAIFSGAFTKIGGLEVLALDLARLFTGKGARTFVLHWPVRGRSPLLGQIAATGARLVPGPVTRGVRWDLPDRALILRARASLRTADLIFFTKLPSNSVLEMLFDSAPQARYVYVPPYMPGEDETYSYAPKPDHALFNRIDCVIAQSDRMIVEVRDLLGYQGRIDHLPMLSSFDPGPLTSFPPLLDGGVRAVFAGRLAPQKNVQGLVDMMLLYRKLEDLEGAPPITLDIYGEGAERRLIEERIRGTGQETRIHLRGAYDRDSLSRIARDHHCFIQMTRSEGQCLAAIESLACGRPMISTDAGCLDEVLKHRTAGMVIPQGHDLHVRFARALAQVAEGIRTGLHDPSAIHADWRERFSHEAVSPRYLSLVSELIGGPA